MNLPSLYLVIPCYNEQEVLPLMAPIFGAEIRRLTDAGKIASDSRILFVDDGSKDETWALIKGLAAEDPVYRGISLSRNRGQQNALLAGLAEAVNFCDMAITLDCDGQDDPAVLEAMIDAFCDGCDIVYGVRKDRSADRLAKRVSAQAFYRILDGMGIESVSNHADCRLLSHRAIEALLMYREDNLYLRGIIPLIGFKSTAVEYERRERRAGKTHYSLSRMLALAADAMTGLSIRPLRIISGLGFFVSFLSAVGIIWSLVQYFTGNTVSGWASTVCIVCLVSGIQLLSLGVIGEYIGKIYTEVKARPRYFIADRTGRD